jgi:hypothetical protein
VPEEAGVERAGKRERHRVEDDDHRLLITVEADERGGEGHERDRREVHEVELHEADVDGDELGEEPVVGQPVEADHEEAQSETEDLALLVAQVLGDLRLLHVRDADAHHEQRHGDGEDRVTEERHPVELELLRATAVARVRIGVRRGVVVELVAH